MRSLGFRVLCDLRVGSRVASPRPEPYDQQDKAMSEDQEGSVRLNSVEEVVQSSRFYTFSDASYRKRSLSDYRGDGPGLPLRPLVTPVALLPARSHYRPAAGRTTKL